MHEVPSDGSLESWEPKFTSFTPSAAASASRGPDCGSSVKSNNPTSSQLRA